MKLWKRCLSLLLTLCMILTMGFMPGTPFGTEAKAAENEEFYKIVHLDAGRKYYSPDVIKQYIDTMATNGFNQLELYMSDNQGFRFALNDMNLTTASGKTYDLSKALGNGYDQDYKSSQLNSYRPSLEPDGQNWLTQTEMTDLIQYARKRGIEIVPCINMPGHMGAILEEFPEFRYKNSQSSIDLEKKEANEFALALLEKYVTYFESQGCKFFNIGGDEYAYDIGNDISICNSATYTDYIVPFMNKAAEIIMEHAMTPRAFNDFFGWNKDAKVTNDFQICYWADIANGGGLKHISELIGMGYDKFINTNEDWYFAVGSAYYTLDSTSAGVNNADPYVFCSKNGHPETYENGLGAMFCIWSDRGRLDNATCNTDTDADGRTTHTNYSSKQEPAGGDGGQIVYELSKPYIELMGSKLPKTPVVFHLDQNEEYVLGEFEGKETAEEWAEKLGLTDNTVVEVQAEQTQVAIPNEIANDPMKAFSNGDLVVVSNKGMQKAVSEEAIVQTEENVEEKLSVATGTQETITEDTLNVEEEPVTEEEPVVEEEPVTEEEPVVEEEPVEEEVVPEGAANEALVTVEDTTGYYLTLTGEELGTTTDPEKATIWTSDGKLLSANGSYLIADPGYAGKDELVVNAKHDGRGWEIVGQDNVMKSTNYGNKYLTLGESGAGASSTPAGVKAYKVVPGVPDLTEVSIIGRAEGIVKFTYDEVEYTLVVGDAKVPVCEHTDLTYHERIEPTQNDYGYEEYWECGDCGKLFADAQAKKSTTLSALRIDKIAHHHILKHFEAKKATVSEPGNIEYWQCLGNVARTIDANGGCGLCFSDSEGRNEIELASTVIPKLEEADGEHTVSVAIGATHTCDKCVITSVGTDLKLKAGSVKDKDDKEIATYTVETETKTDTVGGSGTAGEVISKDTLDALAVNGTVKCVLGNEKKFMKANGSVCSSADADVWTITKVNDEVYTIKGENGYIGDGSSWSPISIGNEAGKWKYDGTQFLNVATYYNGLGLRDGIWQTVYNTTGNNPTPLLPYAVESSGDGEEVTTYTYTFTFTGVQKGSGDLEAGNTIFHVNVKDPAECEHTGGTATCKHGAICELCGKEYTKPDPDNHEHFTKANCVEKAHCTDCDKDFGEVDPTNHKGPTETRYPNGFNSSNHTGDIYCTACDMLIKEGSSIDPNHEIIHMYEDEELEFFVPCGDQPLVLDTDEMDENVVVSVEAEHQAFEAGNPKKPVTDITALENETSLIISDGTNFLKVTENEAGGFDIGVTDKEDEATEFRLSKNPKKPEEFQLSYKGQMLRAEAMNWGSKLKMEAGTSFGSWSWKIKNNAVVAAWWPENGINLTDGAPRLMKDGEGASNVEVYTPNTDTPSGMNVKITAGEEGQTTFGLGQNTYTIIVEPIVLEGQKVTVDYFITNEWTGYEGSKAPDVHSVEITADMRYVNTPDGVELATLVPGDIKHRGFKTIYWKGTKHPADNMQYDMNHTGGNGALDVTKSKDAVDFKYIRFWGGHWSVSWDGSRWTKLDDGDQLVARYLLQTEVTEEVTTEVQDWGETAYSNTYRVLLDFAVKYSSGDVRPDPDAYFIDGTSIFYHAIPGQDKVEDVNGVSHRRIDTIIGRETSDREVYMITLTPTSDDYTKRLEDTQMGAGGKYTYDGTEQIVWLENAETDFPTELTFHPDFQWGSTPATMEGNDRFDDSVLPEGYTNWTEIGNTNGEPYVNQVKIYDHQGMLVTYYIRAKEDTEHNKDQLRVHYLEWINSVDDAFEFYNYGIVVNEGTLFDEGFAQDIEEPIDETGLQNNKVKNDLDFEQTVDSRLEKMPAIPAKYRTGNYILRMVQRADDGKDVYLYYSSESLDRYIVADFGQPLNITWDNVLKGNAAEGVEFDSMEYLSEEEPDKPVYGTVTTALDNQSCIYTPEKVFTGYEKPIRLNVTTKVPVLGEDGNPTDQKERVTEIYVVHIVPATTVYYEPYGKYVTTSNWNVPTDENSTAQATYSVVNEKHPYGYDPMYNNGTDSNVIGKSAGYEIKAEEIGAKASMTFTGTGFELYANCTKNTGRMMVVLRNSDGALVRMTSVDTKIGAGETEGTNFQEWGNAYNVPVVSLNGLSWGTYTAEVTYFEANGDSREDAVKIDGFRVTRPIDNTLSKVVYVQNKESKPSFVEVRDNVLAEVTLPDNWKNDSQYAAQIAKDIYSQVNAKAPENAGIVSAIQIGLEDSGVSEDAEVNFDILDRGPKNEFYLRPGKALVMSVDSTYNYQIGVKVMESQSNVASITTPINGSTDMYYKVVSDNNTITVQNTSSSVLSITKLKCLPKNQSIKDETTAQDIFVPFTEGSLTAALMSLNFDVEVPETPETPDVPEVPGHGTSAEDAQEYVQPTGAHDAYQKGEWCIFKGELYICNGDAIVWTPKEYPQGWIKQKNALKNNGKSKGKNK